MADYSPLMTAPPIYQFPNLSTNYAGLKKWGWHRATELKTAMDNLRVISGEKGYFNVASMYPSINPFSELEGSRFIVVVRNNLYNFLPEGLIAGRDWFTLVVLDDYYIASGVGLELLDAVKNPKMAALKRKARKILLG